MESAGWVFMWTCRFGQGLNVLAVSVSNIGSVKFNFG
jgi:hypothetical protein